MLQACFHLFIRFFGYKHLLNKNICGLQHGKQHRQYAEHCKAVNANEGFYIVLQKFYPAPLTVKCRRERYRKDYRKVQCLIDKICGSVLFHGQTAALCGTV